MQLAWLALKFVESMSAVTPRKISQYLFIQHMKVLIALIFWLKKLSKAIIIAFPFLFVSHTVVSCTACDM